MVDLIISEAGLFGHGWMSFLPYDGSTPLSCPVIDSTSKNKLRHPAEFVKVQERGVFKGGSLFPSPFFVTSTQIDCDNSYPMIWSLGFICSRRGPLNGAQLNRWKGVPGTSPSSAM